MKNHLCIIYDGIENSVFESQLLIPFAQKIASDNNAQGLLISFERTLPQEKYLTVIKNYPQIKLIILKKIPFLGSISLYYAAYQLSKALTGTSVLSVLTRGPLAGWIAGHTKALIGIPTVVQARGLAAQEYAYANNTNIVHRLRTRQYAAVEHWSYGVYGQRSNVTIHAVSNALKEYLVKEFNAPEKKITVETYDIPAALTSLEKATWRQQIRAHIGIPENYYVYVYSGSAKAWQCPQETVAYAAEQYRQYPNTFLLILSQDSAIFHALCTQHAVPAQNYHITTVAHSDIYRYLAAADAGIILREPHPINWVSRPTKILEYQAAGLKIVHNGTVGILSNR